MSRTAGFRCSWIDLLVLAASIPATWWLWEDVGAIAGAVPFPVGHFFLFCNVFRIHRPKELLWAVVCLVNVSAWTLAERLDWALILALQSPLTVAVVIWEMRGPHYHGVWAKRINPRLGEYLDGRLSAGTR